MDPEKPRCSPSRGFFIWGTQESGPNQNSPVENGQGRRGQGRYPSSGKWDQSLFGLIRGQLVSACMFHTENKLRFIEPQLASPVDQPPEGKQWIHEIKYDGFRCQVLLERGWARVFTRNGHDWSDRYSSIVRAASNLRCRSAIIDGEAIVQDGNGASDFDALNSAMRWHPDSIILYAFDLMHLDGTDLRQRGFYTVWSAFRWPRDFVEETRLRANRKPGPL